MDDPLEFRSGFQLVATLPAGCTITALRPEPDGGLVIETTAGDFRTQLRLGLLVFDGERT